MVRQSERFDLYEAAIATLTGRGLTYPCFCTRREIREAATAPHGPAPEGAYPGLCRYLTARQRAERTAAGRPPALRIRTQAEVVRFVDRLAGPVEAVVDDVVLRRNDGTPAYNLAVVVDDAAQGVEEVVRGDDLLLSTPRQLHLAHLLGLPEPRHAHVPLVLGPSGSRLSKRHGAVTLADREAQGEPAAAVRTRLAVSLGLARTGEAVEPRELIERFDPVLLPPAPWVLTPVDVR